MNCPSEERLTRYADRDLSPEESGALQSHLAQCAACRAQLQALDLLLAELRAPGLTDFDAAAHARAVLQRIEMQELPPAAPSSKRRRALIWGAIAACAASVLLLSRGAWQATDHWQARGGVRAGSSARDVGLQLYEAAPSLRALGPGATIRALAPLTAGYRNLGSQPAYLLLFAVDPAGAIHWIAPAYTRQGTDPSATALSPNRDEQLLPHSVQLEDLQPGALRVLTVITRSPAHVSSIEALEHTGVSAHSITARLPQAEVRELRLQVSEDRP